MTRIIVIDDHELAHSGVRLLLSANDEYELAGCYTRARDGIDAAAAAPGGIVMLDLELPDIDGLTALGEIVSRALAGVIVMTGVTRPAALRQALDQGARAIVCKGDPIEEAEQALAAVVRGERFLSTTARALLEKSAPPPVALSERQGAILQLLAAGCSNKEIGYRLSISPPTVSFHLAEIRRKLGAQNSRQLVECARAAGLLDNSAA